LLNTSLDLRWREVAVAQNNFMKVLVFDKRMPLDGINVYSSTPDGSNNFGRKFHMRKASHEMESGRVTYDLDPIREMLPKSRDQHIASFLIHALHSHNMAFQVARFDKLSQHKLFERGRVEI
jgi:hypothetical protein